MPGRSIGVSLLLLAVLAACSVTPRRAAQPVRPATAIAHPAPAAGPPPVPPEATAEFGKALALAHGGHDAAAEAKLESLAQQYPQFSTPLVDLGILRRRDGNLDAAAKALEQAVARNPHSAAAWTELGVTQRLGGKFQDAEQSYAHAVAANPAYAPVYRDRGVLRDLYLDQPAAALADFQQYRKLDGGDKLVVMWIAELSHRTGIKVPPPDAQPSGSAAVASGRPAAAVTPVPAPPPRARN
ncbi:MAG TPA: tetratricopeptide repeat protein [Steroidobacteraceae bacterium]